MQGRGGNATPDSQNHFLSKNNLSFKQTVAFRATEKNKGIDQSLARLMLARKTLK